MSFEDPSIFRIFPIYPAGFLWGTTNPLVKLGTIAANSKTNISPLWAHLSTPAFIIPQAANQIGSALFIYLLGVSGKSH